MKDRAQAGQALAGDTFQATRAGDMLPRQPGPLQAPDRLWGSSGREGMGREWEDKHEGGRPGGRKLEGTSHGSGMRTVGFGVSWCFPGRVRISGSSLLPG